MNCCIKMIQLSMTLKGGLPYTLTIKGYGSILTPVRVNWKMKVMRNPQVFILFSLFSGYLIISSLLPFPIFTARMFKILANASPST